jgi:hypothetical protein
MQKFYSLRRLLQIQKRCLLKKDTPKNVSNNHDLIIQQRTIKQEYKMINNKKLKMWKEAEGKLKKENELCRTAAKI